MCIRDRDGGTITPTGSSVNTKAGFSITTYTGNGTAGATVAHGLGSIPQVVIVKRRSGTEDWMVGGGPILGSGEEGHYLKLNSSAAKATGNGPFNSTNPSSCLLYTSPSPRDKRQSRMPSSA